MLVRHVSGRGAVKAIITHMDRTREHLAADAVLLALALADADRRRLEATLAAIPVGVWIADATGRLTHSNPAAASIWGGASPHAATIEGYSVYRGWWSETGEEVAAEDWTLARTLRTKQSLTDLLEIERFDGKRGHILNSAAPVLDADGTLLGGVVVAMDVTEHREQALERHRLLASLEIERSRLVSIFDKAPSFLAVLQGPDYVFERANPAYLNSSVIATSSDYPSPRRCLKWLARTTRSCSTPFALRESRSSASRCRCFSHVRLIRRSRRAMSISSIYVSRMQTASPRSSRTVTTSPNPC